MFSHQYRIGERRALHVVVGMWFMGVAVFSVLIRPPISAPQEPVTYASLLAVGAEAGVDLKDRGLRRIVRSVLSDHGVSRAPGQDWLETLNGLSLGELTRVAADLNSEVFEYLEDRGADGAEALPDMPAR